MPYDDVEDISDDMNDKLPVYRYAEMGQISGGVLDCKDAKLVAVKDAAFCSSASQHRPSDEHDRCKTATSE